MKWEIGRRDLLAGGLAAGATLALPSGLRAQTAETAPVAPTTALPIAAPVSPVAPERLGEYHKRILAAAKAETERLGTRLWRKDLVGIADFALPSSQPRFHFASLEAGTVRSFYVAHGRGSDQEHDGWLKSFSNVSGSEATSRGGYLTCEWYSGKYGTSIRLVGLDADNSAALDRAIVVHPAKYVDPSMVARWGRIGRSEGCFAMAPGEFNEALWRLSGGRLLFADRIGLPPA
jgi:L,D-transpeptidase catalytic domain